MSNKTLAVICTIIFFVVSVVSTIKSSLIDLGSYVLIDPATEDGHLMTMKESVLHNVTSSMAEGVFAVGALLLLVFLFRKAKALIEYLRDNDLRHDVRSLTLGTPYGGNVASYYDDDDTWLDDMFRENAREKKTRERL